MFRHIQEGEIEVPEDVTIPLRILLRSMLSKDPDQRPTIDQVLSSQWLADANPLSRASTTSYKVVGGQVKLSLSKANGLQSFRKPRSLKPSTMPVVADNRLARAKKEGLTPPLSSSLFRRVPPAGKK
jgi:serine/threonine protein kinase